MWAQGISTIRRHEVSWLINHYFLELLGGQRVLLGKELSGVVAEKARSPRTGRSHLPIFLPGEEGDHVFSRVPPAGGITVERSSALCRARAAQSSWSSSQTSSFGLLLRWTHFEPELQWGWHGHGAWWMFESPFFLQSRQSLTLGLEYTFPRLSISLAEM